MANGYDIAKAAQKYLGTPYVWGGNSLTRGIDCSGLVQQVYAQFGIRVPRVTYDQIGVNKTIGPASLRAGDMVFFDTDRTINGPDHVGIYLGGGKFIHAPRPGSNVKIDDMSSSYYSGRFLGGVRAPGIQATQYDISALSDTKPIGGHEMMKDTRSYGGATDGWEKLQPKLSEEEMASNYGWSYSFLNSEPELKDMFKQAVKETWTAAKFKTKIEGSKWWKNNSDARRQAAVMKASDPASYSAAIDASLMKVRNMANEMGAIVPEGTMKKIAEDAFAGGMNDQQLMRAMGQYINFTAEGTLGGTAGMAEVRMRQLARLNGVDLADQAIKNYAQQIAMGVSTMEQVEQNIRNMAISLFPSYAEQINGGVSMTDIASPYMTQMSMDLEIAPADVDLFDPMIKQALNGINSDGQPTGMTITDFQKFTRNDPRWLKTNNGREQIMAAGSEVLKTMGLI